MTAHPSTRPTRRLVRRGLAGVAAVAATVLALPAPAAQAACPAGDQCTALPDVNARKVVLAATLDPWRTDDVKTPGASTSVLRVERALVADGLLASTYADGYWGTTTTAAWGRYEKSIGQNGIHTRNGLPSPAELRKFGAGRFDVVKSYDVGGRVTVAKAPAGNSDDGTEVVNRRTLDMFLEAQRNMVRRGDVGKDMTITQGSYCDASCAPESFGTHDGGGIIDVRIIDTNATGVAKRLAALREVGFAAWERSNHIHAVALNDYQMAWAVHGVGGAPAPIVDDGWTGYCQVYEWVYKGDGLGHCDQRVPSTSAQRTVVTWEDYLAAKG
ncbi:hypothetical protein [Phycicoccus sonneratiae]|uniref:Peptidoglycan-binding protein n=1 Tax=Phycicoccus sonneratiae TaxID=2807628 RepID=A0ABS2CMR3_9MICO|nr:hypothetical protein [Phycicoccus sonneraticus]MBM6401161.1 hypothetical protein [Phycicoccus sonneraticus]